MQRVESAVVAALFLTIPVPAAAQHWSLDARRIALGGVGSANLASELVADRRAYKAIVLPLGLFRSLGNLDVYRSLDDPADPDFDPVRALELLASPLHYASARPESPSLRAFVHDLANDELSRDLGVYREVPMPDRILWEGLVSPNWGRTFVLSGERGGPFQGLYVGAGPYLSARTDTRIDPDLTETLARSAEADGGLPANVTFHSAHATAVQVAAAVTGGYRARFPFPGEGAYERDDGIYVAADYHYLHGLRLGHVDSVVDFTTNEAGLLAGDGRTAQLGFYETATSGSGRGLAVDTGVKVVVGHVDIGFAARGLGNRLEWTDVEGESEVIEVEIDSAGSSSLSVSDLLRNRSVLGDTLRVELPVHYTADVGYHADGWSALAEYGHGFMGHRMHAGVELRRGWFELRGGGRFLRDRWHPSIGVGLNRLAGPSFDIALFGASANAARKRTVAIAASLRLNADSLFE